jgi:nucleotide-binding universal stress UspA family protein
MDLKALIPLDGTRMSETALQLVPWLRSIGVTEVRLVCVWEGLWELPEGANPSREMLEAEERGVTYLNAYLQKHKAEVETQGVVVKTSGLLGRPAEALLEAAKTTKPDLIMIATHGRSGIARWRLGSVANKLVRGAETPILVIGPNVEADLTSFSTKRILVPLDGSKAAEAVVGIAARLASITRAELDLVDVAILKSTPYAASSEFAVDAYGVLEDSARVYLDSVRARLSAEQSIRCEVLVGHPPDELVRWAEDKNVDLVVMTTHARHGLARTILGSVADSLLLGPAPVLLLRAEEAASSGLADAAAV